MWMNPLKMNSCPTVFWHELDGKMGHVEKKASVTHSPVPQSCFPMVYNSLLPDLMETLKQASE